MDNTDIKKSYSENKELYNNIKQLLSGLDTITNNINLQIEEKQSQIQKQHELLFKCAVSHQTICKLLF